MLVFWGTGISEILKAKQKQPSGSKVIWYKNYFYLKAKQKKPSGSKVIWYKIIFTKSNNPFRKDILLDISYLEL